MAKSFHLTVARIGENLFDGEAVSVILPGTEGVFTVFAHHEAFVSELKPGLIRAVAADGQTYNFELAHKGLAEISNNQATVIL